MQNVARNGYELESIDSLVAHPDFEEQCKQQCVAMQQVVAALFHDSPTLAIESGLEFYLLDNIDSICCTTLILRCSRALSPDNARLDATGLLKSKHWYAHVCMPMYVLLMYALYYTIAQEREPYSLHTIESDINIGHQHKSSSSNGYCAGTVTFAHDDPTTTRRVTRH